jgi:vitamin B12 transporter
MKKHFFVLAAVFIGSQLQAQTDSTGKLLDEVVMTANKYPNKTLLTGKVVTIITKEQLGKSGGKDLSQLLAEQAGVYIAGANSNAGKDKSVYLRGARIDHTLITVDGVPVYDASGIGSNFDIRNISIDQVERIEILKGSQSTLYGSDAIAGVINIITKKNFSNLFSGNGRLSYGSNNSFRANTAVNGKSGILDYTVSYSFIDTEGINEAISNAANADKDGFQQNSVQAGIGIQAAKNIRLQPYLRFSKIEGDIDQGNFTDELDYIYEQKSYQAGIRNEFSFGKTKLNLLYNFNSIDRLYTDDSVKSRNGFDIYSRGSYKGAEHFIDAFINVPVGSGVTTFTSGADFRSSNTDQEYSSVGFFGPYSTKYSGDSLYQNQLGLYAALNVHAASGFNLELGNRVNIHSGYGSNYVFNINPSYLLNLADQQAGNKMKFFANFSSGYRTPSLYQLFSEYGNKELEPESAFTAEGGLQYFSRDNKFNGRVTAFARNVKDVIFFYFNPVTFQSQYINQDKQKDYGTEIEVSFSPAKNILLKAFYSFVDGKITTKQGGKDTTFFNLLRRPRHSVGFNAGIKITEKIFVNSNLSWFGQREDAYFDPQTFRTERVTLESYLLCDVYAEYSFCKNKLKLFADLRNITSSKYNEVAGFNTLRFNGYGGIRFSL